MHSRNQHQFLNSPSVCFAVVVCQPACKGRQTRALAHQLQTLSRSHTSAWQLQTRICIHAASTYSHAGVCCLAICVPLAVRVRQPGSCKLAAHPAASIYLGIHAGVCCLDSRTSWGSFWGAKQHRQCSLLAPPCIGLTLNWQTHIRAGDPNQIQ
eukprot:scaffold37804_cov22-Tisochrysis_lutea.AAC.1